MEFVKYIDDISQINVFCKCGSVVGQSVWSETRVTGHSSGGGGYIQGGSGHVSAPSIALSSKIDERQRIFVQENDESEFEIAESNLGFGVREGHRIAVVYVGDKESGRGHLMSVINQTTKNYKIYYDRINWLVRSGDRVSGCAAIVFLPVLFSFLVAALMISFLIFSPSYYSDWLVEIIDGEGGGFFVSSLFFGSGLLAFLAVLSKLSVGSKRRGVLRSQVIQVIEREVAQKLGAPE